MAWNEPGGNKNKDPWDREKDRWGKGGDQKGPPDLDELVHRLKHRLSNLFGGGTRTPGGGGGPTLGPGGKAIGIGLLLLVAVVVWLLSGIYIVNPGQQGVVLRFGAYARTTNPGPHWHLPYPIESVKLVDVAKIRSYEIGYRSSGMGGESPVPAEALMLTKDQNIVAVRIAVQYRVKNPANYVFNVRSPDRVLRAVVESALRAVVGQHEMDFVLTTGRSEIVHQTKEISQRVLDSYKSGLMVTSVNMQDAQPPEQVQPAFADAIKAREDQQRLINQAQAYANGIIPKARGAAFRLIQEAKAYAEQVVAQAKGETARFLQILAAYQAAPDITRERLSLETMESVLEHSRKVLVDVPEGTNVFYLPLGRMLEKNEGNQKTHSMEQSFGLSDSAQERHGNENNNNRSRRSRRVRR